MMRVTFVAAKLKFGTLVGALAVLCATPVQSRPGLVKDDTYACISWDAAHWYTIQSLTPKGGQIDKNCPIRLPKGTKVDIIKDDDDGYAVVIHRGRTWWVDGERVQ
jgi:hypothetical protein